MGRAAFHSHSACGRDLPFPAVIFTPCHGLKRVTSTMHFFSWQCIEQNMNLYIIFLDLTKAFGTVSRAALLMLLENPAVHNGHHYNSALQTMSNCLSRHCSGLILNVTFACKPTKGCLHDAAWCDSRVSVLCNRFCVFCVTGSRHGSRHSWAGQGQPHGPAAECLHDAAPHAA